MTCLQEKLTRNPRNLNNRSKADVQKERAAPTVFLGGPPALSFLFLQEEDGGSIAGTRQRMKKENEIITKLMQGVLGGTSKRETAVGGERDAVDQT
mmetsp:Transcript_13764/g.27369  ORF Transcript_13764/g.27369 Transcript_13764/m.27369 type:complete len:96 (-) Transcript_13764:1499-1786(-)